jgi:hypothetical protein
LRTNLAMRGGTALHKVHLAAAARYSEDIDLVLLARWRPAVVKWHLTRVLRPEMHSSPRRVDDVIVGLRNSGKKNFGTPSKIIRQNYPYQPGKPRAYLKIEVNCSEHASISEVAEIPFKFGADELSLRTYDIDEMLGTKLRALLQRDRSRDLFDLDRALTSPLRSHVPDPDRIVYAFRKYMEGKGSAVDADAFRRDLDRKLESKTFRKDTDRMLRTGLSLDIAAAAERVRRELLDRLDPAPGLQTVP